MPWSSYRCFSSNDKPPGWLNINFILSIFDDNILKAKKLYTQFVLNGIGTEKDVINENIHAGLVLGSNDFFESVKRKFITQKYSYELPVLKEIKAAADPTLEDVQKTVEANIQGDNRLKRKLAIYLSRKHTQKTLNQIADFYGSIKYTGVSQLFKRMQKQRSKDRHLDTLLADLERRICQI